MGCSDRLWRRLLPRLAQAAPGLDVRYGELTRDSVQECVTELLDRLPACYSLAGLSLGGVVALALVSRAPDRVARLALLSTNPHAPTRDQQLAWAAQRRRLAQGTTARELQQDLLPLLLSPQARSPRLDEEVLAMVEDIGGETLDRQLAAQSTRIDERPTLGELEMPTLVLAGGADAMVSVARHQETAQLCPQARLVVLPGVGHLTSLEAPGRVAAALTDWLCSPATC